METSPVAGVASLLFLVLLVLAPIAILRSPLRLKTALHILAGMAAGLAAGIAVGTTSGSGELAGHVAFLLGRLGSNMYSVPPTMCEQHKRHRAQHASHSVQRAPASQ
jgi:hypothetical protein